MSSNHQVTSKKIKITSKLHIFNITTVISPLILEKFVPKNEIYSQYYEIWHSDIKASISPLIPEKFGPENEIYSQYYEIWHSEQVRFLIMNMIFEIADLDPKLKTWANLVSELQCTPTFVKFGT